MMGFVFIGIFAPLATDKTDVTDLHRLFVNSN
jgi:hypothetical protein